MYTKSSKLSVNLVATLTGHKDSVYAMTGDDNGLIFSAGSDGMVVEWDLSKPKDGQVIAQVGASVYSMFYFEGYLAIGKNHDGVIFLDLASRKMADTIVLQGCGAIYDVYFDEKYAYACAQNGFLYQIERDTRKVKKIKVSDKSLRSITFLNNNNFLITDSEGKVREYDINFEELISFNEASKSVFKSIQISDKYLTISRDCRLRVYNENKMKGEIVAHIYPINYIEKSPDSSLFATASQDKTLKIWSSEDVKLIKVLDSSRHGGHQNSVNKLFWSKYSNLLVSCSDDRTLKVWDLKMESE